MTYPFVTCDPPLGHSYSVPQEQSQGKGYLLYLETRRIAKIGPVQGLGYPAKVLPSALGRAVVPVGLLGWVGRC
jgi:hypothetical protein